MWKYLLSALLLQVPTREERRIEKLEEKNNGLWDRIDRLELEVARLRDENARLRAALHDRDAPNNGH